MKSIQQGAGMSAPTHKERFTENSGKDAEEKKKSSNFLQSRCHKNKSYFKKTQNPPDKCTAEGGQNQHRDMQEMSWGMPETAGLTAQGSSTQPYMTNEAAAAEAIKSALLCQLDVLKYLQRIIYTGNNDERLIFSPFFNRSCAVLHQTLLKKY